MSLVLHTLRCVGTAGEERLASVTGLARDEVTRDLAALAESDLVVSDPGPFGGWSITDLGRGEDDEMLRAEIASPGSRALVSNAYQVFLALNPVLLSVCSDWQMRRIGNSPVLNDHSDTEYDVVVLDRLGRVHDDVTAILDDLIAAFGRFAMYQVRLDMALEGALGGRVEAVADSFDSYHSVWFQLHEDLLTTLGLSREDERRRLAGEV